MFKSYTFILIAVLFCCISCNDDDDHGSVPSVHVNRTLNLNSPSNSDLNPRGGYRYLHDEGYRGIIVYHKLEGDYVAFDRACTYHPHAECALVSVRSSGIEFACGQYEEVDGENEWKECCGSHFYTDGTVQSGPARRPLKEYTVIQDGSHLNIRN